MTALIEEPVVAPAEVLAPGITPEAAAHLRRAVQAMREHADRVHMGFWWERMAANGEEGCQEECQTVGCICGWMINTLPYDIRLGVARFESGMCLLRITYDQATVLFMEGDWPRHFIDALALTEPRTPEYVEVIAQRVDHFLRTGN